MKRKVEEEAEEGDFQHNRIFSLPHPPMHQPPLPPMPPHQPPLPPMPPHQPPPPMSHHPPLPMSHQLGQPHFVGRGRGPWMQRRQQELMRGGFGAAGSPNGNMVNGNMMGARHFFRGARGMPNNIGPPSNRGFFPRARGPRFSNSFQREFYQENYRNQPPMPIPFQQQPMPHPPLSPSSHQMQPHQRPEGEGCNQGNALPKVRTEETITKCKSSKRRSMSQSYPSRPWNKEDAEKALREEAAHLRGLKSHSLVIRFPDPDLSKDIVKTFHPAIDNVHFQIPSGARYCFVQLCENVDPDKTIEELQKIKFGCGTLVVEKKYTKEEEEVLSPEDIDPYTLYVGNLPTNVTVPCVKQKFATAARVDIGFSQRMKLTRYAFVRYNNIDEAIEAYRQTHNLILDSRSIIVRFRRQRGHIGLPGEPKPQKEPKKNGEKVKVKSKKDKEKDKDKEKVKTKVKVKEKGKEIAKPPKVKEELKSDDGEDDDDDEEDDDSDSDDDEDDDDDEEEEDDDEEEDDEEDDDDDDDDDEDEDEEIDNDPTRSLFRAIDAQINGIDGMSFPFLTD